MKKIIAFIVVIFFTCSVIAQKQIVTIQLHHKVGKENLSLQNKTYFNVFNEPFTIQKFRYYISNIILIDDEQKQYNFPEQYFLIDEANSASKTIQLQTNVRHLKQIQFLLGVDSIKNVTGVQEGTLDPMKGMFWTWKSGYIFAKLEGQSDSSHLPSHYFTYHIGGINQNENALRVVQLNIPATYNQSKKIIHIDADILQWFSSVHPIKIASTGYCHQPGMLSVAIADNYSKMFSINK